MLALFEPLMKISGRWDTDMALEYLTLIFPKASATRG